MNITVHNVLPLHNMTLEVLMTPPSENRYTTLIKRSLSFCDFAMGKYVDPIMKLIYEEFKLKGAKFISKCPVPLVGRTVFKCNPKN